MKLLLLIILTILSLNTWAAWNLEVALGIDGETWKIERDKFEDGKESTFTMGNYILKMTIKTSTEKHMLDVVYTVQEKKQGKLILINKGTDLIDERKPNDIYAKGEPSQPHSIITIKFKKP